MSKLRKGEKTAKLGKTYMILKPFREEKLPVQTISYIGNPYEIECALLGPVQSTRVKMLLSQKAQKLKQALSVI